MSMSVHLRTVGVSSHLNPFCRGLFSRVKDFKLVVASTRYSNMREKIGWSTDVDYPVAVDSAALREKANEVDVLIDMLREMPIFEARTKAKRKTFYMSERWFKPIVVQGLIGCRVRLPGVLRMLTPKYLKMAKRFAHLMDDSSFHLLPIGIHAVRDMVRLYRISNGEWKFLFVEPKVGVDRCLGGEVKGFPRMHLWSYFVEPSVRRCDEGGRAGESFLKILWVGRMLDWKRVDVLVKAFRRLKREAALLLVGEGPERVRLERLAGSLKKVGCEGACVWEKGKIVFHDYVKSDVVRELMREASVYVMPSNAEEGWGAAVSDALAEGCPVISTYEAGSSATLLNETSLFHSGDIEALVQLLEGFKPLRLAARNGWSGDEAAKIILEL